MGTEVCEKDMSDGDDIVLAVCGASSKTRSSTYTQQPYKSNVVMAHRIVDALNNYDALLAQHTRLKERLLCKGKPGEAHYCSHCDNSLWVTGLHDRAAAQQTPDGQEKGHE
jgi:hypothetical protein